MTLIDKSCCQNKEARKKFTTYHKVIHLFSSKSKQNAEIWLFQKLESWDSLFKNLTGGSWASDPLGSPTKARNCNYFYLTLKWMGRLGFTLSFDYYSLILNNSSGGSRISCEGRGLGLELHVTNELFTKFKIGCLVTRSARSDKFKLCKFYVLFKQPPPHQQTNTHISHG